MIYHIDEYLSYMLKIQFCLNQLLEERQLIWDQREVELERQLDTYEKRQNDILSTAQKVPCDTFAFNFMSLEFVSWTVLFITQTTEMWFNVCLTCLV